jgi:aryl-alcohol dehydrogenase-like predicted oxidoreductase
MKLGCTSRRQLPGYVAFAEGTTTMTAKRSDRMGIGLAALGRPAYITAGRGRDVGAERSIHGLRARTAAVLDAAYAGGVRYVDTARSYGHAEEFLAAWLASRPDITDVYLASKWGYRYVGQWRMDSDVHEVKEHSVTAFAEQLRDTRALLGDRLDLYQVHSVTEDSPLLGDVQLQRALADLRDSGVRIGLSTSGPRQADALRAALDLEVCGAPLFSSVQSTWNLLEPSVGEVLSEAHDAGVAVVVKEVFANGRLAPGSGDTAPGVRRASQMADDLGIEVDQLALAAAIHQPWCSRVLSGAVTVPQVQSHLTGVDVDLAPGVVDALADLAEDPTDYWAARARRPWT